MADNERALGAITSEDLEFERKLQETAEDAPDIEQGPNTTLKKEKQFPKLLKEHVENYVPAKTHSDLLEQIHLAKEVGADSIEAEPKIIRQLTLKSGYPEEAGFFFMQDVKVWIPGRYDMDLDKVNYESKMFAKSRVSGITPIMDDKPQR